MGRRSATALPRPLQGSAAHWPTPTPGTGSRPRRGLMNPRTVRVDEAASYAHRRNEAVHVILRVPQEDGHAVTGAEVRLHAGSRRFRVPARALTSTGFVVLDFDEALRPSSATRSGGWPIVRAPRSPSSVLQARLLARPGQPVAVLAGPEPETRLPALMPDSCRAAIGAVASQPSGAGSKSAEERPKRTPVGTRSVSMRSRSSAWMSALRTVVGRMGRRARLSAPGRPVPWDDPR